MGLILALAAISVAGALWQGAGPSALFVIGSAIAIAVIPSQTLGVAVMALMLITTAAAIAAAWMKKAHPFQALMFAAADGLAVWALWLSHLESTTWSLPGQGDWGDGSVMLALAAIARVGAGLVPMGSAHSALGMLGWWVGVSLAWLAGPPALPVFAVAAAIILASALMGSHASSALGFAGAVAAVAAGLGAGVPTVAGIAGAGAAMALGAPMLGLFGWAAVPLSAASDLDVPIGLAAGLALPAAPLLMAIAAEGAIASRSGQRAGGVTGWAAIAVGFFGSVVDAVWLVAAGAAAFALSRALSNDSPVVPKPDRAAPEPVLVTANLFAAAGVWLTSAAGLAALWLRGLGTDFL